MKDGSSEYFERRTRGETRVTSKDAMRSKLAIVRPFSRGAERDSLDAFHIDELQQHLARFREKPGILSQYIERTRTRFQKASERRIVEDWTAFYTAGQRLLATRTEMERRKSEYLMLAHEHELKVRGSEANLCKLEADIEEHNLRRDKAAYQRQHLERFVESGTRGNVSENEQKLNEAHERRQLDARWELNESLRALHSLIELQHWRRQQRDRILQDRSLTAEEQGEDLQFVDELYQQKRGELKVDTRIFEEE